MLMVKNREKNRGKTGENRAETGPPGQSPQARFIGWFSPRFSPVLPGFARFFYLAAAAGCTPSGHLAIQRLVVAGIFFCFSLHQQHSALWAMAYQWYLKTRPPSHCAFVFAPSHVNTLQVRGASVGELCVGRCAVR